MRRPNHFPPNQTDADEDARVTTPTALERAIQRYGDDWYRLALLLTSDENIAVAALRDAASRLTASQADILHEPDLVRALFAALPKERRRLRPRRLPAWARLPAARPEAPLVAALARLPRQQRLALGLLLLRGFEPPQAAAMLGGDEAHIRTLMRDALRSLAPRVRPPLTLADLDADSAPEACRPTRMALALGSDLAHADSTARGHLALCAACRAAEQTWAQLTIATENALRGVLRRAALPDQLANDLRNASISALPQPRLSILVGHRKRLAALAAVVLAVVALLVLPGRRESPATNGLSNTGAALAPYDLVARAHDRLYAPPDGNGIWHGRWEIRWTFPAGSYALLNADAWIDTASSRHRVQLTHHDGGSPFEFELADDTDNLWYATTPNYNISLAPASFESARLRALLRLKPADKQRMLQARLESGAWDIAAAYLRQATAARDLNSWGRQRTADGAMLDVLGFDGVSPLAPPADAPDQPSIPTTILLSIDAQSGALREVRELIGPEGAERSTRTTWRYVDGEWLADERQIADTFDVQRAWNGIGGFARQAGIADPALPLEAADQTMSLAQVVQGSRTLQLPSAPPAGATRAILLTDPANPAITTVYIGAGRRLELRTFPSNGIVEPDLEGADQITINGQQVFLRPFGGQGYQARLIYRGLQPDSITTWIGALGYTRAELLDLLRGLGPPTTASYRAQASLFADPQPHDAAAVEALLAGLADPPAPPTGSVRHFVEHTFTRHNPAPDPLSDPYHLPPYGGRPEELFVDNWVRHDSNGALESATAERDADGTVYGRQYLGPEIIWYYDATQSQASRLRTGDLPLPNRINQDQGLVLDLLARGDSRIANLSDGTRVISYSQTLPQTRYADLLTSQQRDPGASGPYLLDLASDATITTRLYLGDSGRLQRIETWATGTAAVVIIHSSSVTETQQIAMQGGDPHNSILLESWELTSEEHIPLDRVPAKTFDTTPPASLELWDYFGDQHESGPLEPRTTTITDALALAQTPLFAPQGAGQTPPLIEIGAPSATGTVIWGNDIFDSALRAGMAVRFTYWLTTSTALDRLMYIYQGDAESFGAFLRARSSWGWRWQSSEPVQVALAGRTIGGWRVTLTDGATWTLFEVDGTLLAAQTTDSRQHAALEQLAPLQRP
jgi:DNA-directed RNA polymerase specialized sigma24 family protein